MSMEFAAPAPSPASLHYTLPLFLKRIALASEAHMILIAAVLMVVISTAYGLLPQA